MRGNIASASWISIDQPADERSVRAKTCLLFVTYHVPPTSPHFSTRLNERNSYLRISWMARPQPLIPAPIMRTSVSRDMVKNRTQVRKDSSLGKVFNGTFIACPYRPDLLSLPA